MRKLSIIIPVYNVEKYIKKCINSILNQNLNPNEYEIIIVDDESPDNSVLIIKQFQLNNPQIKLFSQKNKGLGGARNTGINNAKGKYILFLDADDYIIENTLNTIISVAINNNLDILEFGANGVLENGDIVYKKSIKTIDILNGYEYLSQNQYMNSACNKLYSSSFLRNNNLLFKERIFIEDFEFNTRVFYFAKRVLASDNIVANFVQTSNSITRNNDLEKRKKMVYDVLKVVDLTIDFFNSSNFNNKKQKSVIEERISFLNTTILYLMFKFNFNKLIRLKIINTMKEKNNFPNRKIIKDKKKNLFRLLTNNLFLYNTICTIKTSLTN